MAMPEAGGESAFPGAEDETASASARAEAALDPTAAALAALASQNSSELAQQAAAYFRKQTLLVEAQSQLVQIQTEHLHEQRAVNLSLLKLRRFGERLKLGLQLAVGVAAAVLAVALMRMVWSALGDHELVVEAFAVPPDMAVRGITGQVLAAQVLDKLGQINAQANSSRAPSSYAGDWQHEVKVEIPETGVSISELQRFFRDWLGHETHITGEVIHASDGLSMTVRAGEEPGRTVSAPESELSALTQLAAEAAFESTQPYRYSMYLKETGRRTQALEVARKLALTGPTKRERAWAWAAVVDQLGDAGDVAGSMQAGLNAIEIDPSLALSYLNVSGAAYFSGDDEKNLQYEREGLKRLEIDTTDLAPDGRAALRFENTAVLADLLGDFQKAAKNYQALASGPEFENWKQIAPLGQSYELARQHDAAGSLAIMAHHPVSDAQALEYLSQMTEDFVAGYERALAVDDWTAAAADMHEAISAAPHWPEFAPIAVPLLLQPRLAYALARAGRQAEAESAAATLSKTCYRCARARGWVAATARDWPRADREFADAVRQAPSLPFAYADWGVALLERGDADGAIGKFATAHERGPHFADALELWGEALLTKGDYSSAIEKFSQAAQFAPRWGHLYLMWGHALDRAGKHDAALEQYRHAADMDLSAADRAALGAQAHS